MKRDLRLLPVAGAVWTIALACVLVPPLVPWLVLACLLGAFGCLGALAWRRRARDAVGRGGLVVVLLAASAAVGFSVMVALPEREFVGTWDGRVVEITGDITSSASLGRDGRLWIDVQLTGIGPPGDVRPASAPVRIGLEPAEGYDLGAGISLTGETLTTDAGERSALVVFASAAAVERPAEGVFAVAAEIRQAFVQRSVRLPEPGAGLLPGLAVGDTRAVSTELNDDMRTSGLSHLTAVSGLTICPETSRKPDPRGQCC